MNEPPIISQIAGATLWLASLALIMLISSIKEEIERRRIEKRNRELEAQNRKLLMREAEYRAEQIAKQQAEYAYYQHKKNFSTEGIEVPFHGDIRAQTVQSEE
ncbi:hypothetical protein [Streptococcus gordonii]|uniref:hypothetical protein n=1 Tax=Streptococcus gordonii TaxID=1302 RepID=UPI00205A9CCE|nr:hypothetical protein [Streptococcus gordonii]MCY7132221.1 hypothetical protein [Streptococcus gordonii]DAK75505.1 MAG TPA: peptidase [Caudoviricetes sp.]